MDASSSHALDVRADRFRTFGETIFAEMNRLAQQHDAVNLGQGFPSFDGPDAMLKAAARAMQEGHNQYSPTTGVPALTKAVAGLFTSTSGIATDPAEHVTITVGCTEALGAATLGLVNPGDEVILFEPYYDCYLADVLMAGATPRFVTLQPPRFDFDEQALADAFSVRTRAIILNTPHNPTGRIFDRGQLEFIAELCQVHDVLVFADEVYERLVYEGEHIHIASVDGMWERTVTMSGLGKTYSATGWRIGWTIAPGHLTHAIRTAHQFLTFGAPTPLQHGAIAALEVADSYYSDLVQLLRRRRDLLADGLSDLGFTVYRPAAGYFILADHTSFGFDNDVAFARHMVEQLGVAAIPPSSFYSRPERGASLMRFAFCKDESMIEQGIARLARLK